MDPNKPNNNFPPNPFNPNNLASTPPAPSGTQAQDPSPTSNPAPVNPPTDPNSNFVGASGNSWTLAPSPEPTSPAMWGKDSNPAVPNPSTPPAPSGSPLDTNWSAALPTPPANPTSAPTLPPLPDEHASSTPPAASTDWSLPPADQKPDSSLPPSDPKPDIAGGMSAGNTSASTVPTSFGAPMPEATPSLSWSPQPGNLPNNSASNLPDPSSPMSSLTPTSPTDAHQSSAMTGGSSWSADQIHDSTVASSPSSVTGDLSGSIGTSLQPAESTSSFGSTGSDSSSSVGSGLNLPSNPAPTPAGDAAPTDLSHLIGSNASTPTASLQTSATPAVTASAPSGSPTPNPVVASHNIPTNGGSENFPKWLIILGVVILLGAIAASAYFILGVGKTTSTTSTPIDKQLTNPPVPTTAPKQDPTPTLAATPSATPAATLTATPKATGSATSVLRTQKTQ